MFTVLCEVIYVKFYMELERRSFVSLALSIFTALTFYGFISLISGSNEVMNFLTGRKYVDLFHYTFLSYNSTLIMITSPIVIVLPDYAIKSILEIFAVRRHNKSLLEIKDIARKEVAQE